MLPKFLTSSRGAWIVFPWGIAALASAGFAYLFYRLPWHSWVAAMLGVLWVFMVFLTVAVLLGRWRHQGDQTLWRIVHQELRVPAWRRELYWRVHEAFGAEWGDFREFTRWQVYILKGKGAPLGFMALPIPLGSWDGTWWLWGKFLAIEQEWVRQEWIYQTPLVDQFKTQFPDRALILPPPISQWEDPTQVDAWVKHIHGGFTDLEGGE